MTYPQNDTEFEERTITAVEKQSDGSFAIGTGATWLHCGEHVPIKPREGMTARFYGKGFGSRVRGLFIDGKRFWYRTDAEDKEHGEIQLYGRDAADWLERWDAGKGIWTIEMGGLGPGYEQAIVVTTAEIVRWLLADKPTEEDFADDERRVALSKRIDDASFKNEVIDKMGLSGAQFGAAKQVACLIYRKGPRGVMNDPQVKDRHIQASKNFP